MTERERKMIEVYLPNEADPALGDEEFYCRDLAGRVQRVRVVRMFPYKDDDTVYCVIQTETGKCVHGWYGQEPFTGFMRGELYDNRQDCKDATHDMFNGWEQLREIQKREKGRS